jgi:hypothetical protein
VWIVIVKCGAVLGDLLYDPSLPMANVWSELSYPSFFNVLIIKTIPSFITGVELVTHEEIIPF